MTAAVTPLPPEQSHSNLESSENCVSASTSPALTNINENNSSSDSLKLKFEPNVDEPKDIKPSVTELVMPSPVSISQIADQWANQKTVFDTLCRMGSSTLTSLGSGSTAASTQQPPQNQNHSIGSPQSGPDASITLWQFLLELLNTNEHPTLIQWTNQANGEFK
uniref:ETS domain-containing protein n=1 Tax=Panagrolaimus sp. PS1159 TaxID=55785 RepID=A0AC35G969_9BILA